MGIKIISRQYELYLGEGDGNIICQLRAPEFLVCATGMSVLFAVVTPFLFVHL